MDPNANLRELIELANQIAVGPETLLVQDYDRFAELVLALDGWLIKGGFLPQRWKDARKNVERLNLEMAIAITDCLASAEEYKGWLETHSASFGGMSGVYQHILFLAVGAVEEELRHDHTENLYEISERIADELLRNPTLTAGQLYPLIADLVKKGAS